MVHAAVVLVVAATHAGIRRVVVRIGERRSSTVGVSSKVLQTFSRGIDPVRGDNVARELLAGDDVVAVGVLGTRGISKPAAGCERIVNRYGGSAGVAYVGEIAVTHRIGRNRIHIRS